MLRSGVIRRFHLGIGLAIGSWMGILPGNLAVRLRDGFRKTGDIPFGGRMLSGRNCATGELADYEGKLLFRPEPGLRSR